MPIVTADQIEKMKKEQATIKRVLGGFQGPWLPHVYDNRTECWKENIAEVERLRLAKDGKNGQMQTPEQVKAFEARKKVSEDRKRKAELAAEMAFQNK